MIDPNNSAAKKELSTVVASIKKAKQKEKAAFGKLFEQDFYEEKK